MKRTRIFILNPPFLPKFSRSQRSPAVIKSGTMYYPIWLAYCAGLLEKEGFEIRLVDAPAEGLTFDETAGIFDAFSPHLLISDTSTPSIYSDVRVVEELKKRRPDCLTVLVGTHVSVTAEETLGLSSAIDAVARGEYDGTVLDLAQRMGADASESIEKLLGGVAGLSVRVKGRVIHNPARPHMENLDDFPFVSEVYRRHLRVENYFYSITQYPEVTIITGRGCPHRCIYCVYPQTMFGHKYRHRSPGNVAAEFRYIRENFPQVKEVFIEDDTFTVNKGYCRDLCRLLITEKVGLPWTANSRADIDGETLLLMKEAGCRLLCIGVESGTQEILDNMKKGLRLEQVEDFAGNARRAGILVHACFMVGNPGETRESMRRTLDFAKKLKPDTAQFFPIMVYPGTEAFRWAKDHDYLTTLDYSCWLTHEGLHNCILSTPDLSSEALVGFCDYARRSFYLRPSYVFSKLLQVVTHPSEARRIVRSFAIFKRYLLKGGPGG